MSSTKYIFNTKLADMRKMTLVWVAAADHVTGAAILMLIVMVGMMQPPACAACLSSYSVIMKTSLDTLSITFKQRDRHSKIEKQFKIIFETLGWHFPGYLKQGMLSTAEVDNADEYF